MTTEVEDKINKQVIFRENDKMHADFKLRCDYEGISQSAFFRLMLRKMIEKDKKILALIDEFKKEKNIETIRRRKQIEDDRLKKEEFDKEFGMSEDQIRNLYDIFDNE